MNYINDCDRRIHDLGIASRKAGQDYADSKQRATDVRDKVENAFLGLIAAFVFAALFLGAWLN